MRSLIPILGIRDDNVVLGTVEGNRGVSHGFSLNALNLIRNAPVSLPPINKNTLSFRMDPPTGGGMRNLHNVLQNLIK